MKLSKLSPIFPIEVLRDAEFTSLGKTTHELRNMLVFLESTKFLREVNSNSNISCIVTKADLVDQLPTHYGVAIADDPRSVFWEIHDHLATKTAFYWHNFPTSVHKTSIVDPSAYVAPFNVKIGRGSRIGPRAVVLERCIIENDVIIGPGTCLGDEGYEYGRARSGAAKRVVHAGGLKVCNRVEVHANCVIDRPIFGDFSIIGEDTKIDNLVNISHRVMIGKRCLIVAGAVICGNVTIGNDVWVGPNALVSSGLKIGNGAEVSLGSVVVRDVKEKEHVTGFFAVEHSRFLDWMKECNIVGRADTLRKEI